MGKILSLLIDKFPLLAAIFKSLLLLFLILFPVILPFYGVYARRTLLCQKGLPKTPQPSSAPATYKFIPLL